MLSGMRVCGFSIFIFYLSSLFRTENDDLILDVFAPWLNFVSQPFHELYFLRFAFADC